LGKVDYQCLAAAEQVYDTPGKRAHRSERASASSAASWA
jgi:hypothetical protein